jgi:nitroreductase
VPISCQGVDIAALRFYIADVRLTSWTDLLELARWAPSPHNIQPWRLRALANGDAELLCASDRLLPETDPTGRFSFVGLGVFVETLAIAARARGSDVEADFTCEPLAPGERDLLPVGRLRLVPFDRDEPLDPALIVERRTSRIPYDGRSVPPVAIDELAAVADDSGHTLTCSSDRALVDFVLDLNRETLFFDMTDAGARREVGRWLRFDRASAERTRDGFSPEALAFPGWLLRAFFRAHAFDVPLVRTVRDALYMRTMRGTRTVGWIQGPFEREADWLAAGRMLARLWLTMTKLGLHLHPFGSIITNPDANERVRERIPHDPSDGTLWLIMRLGSGEQPARSLRLEVDELLAR